MSGRPPKILTKIAEDVEGALASMQACEDSYYEVAQRLLDFIVDYGRGELRIGQIKALADKFMCVGKRLEDARSDLKAANQLLDVLRTEQRLLLPKNNKGGGKK